MAADADREPPRVVAQLGAPSLRGVARLVAIVAACAGALYVLYLTRGVVKILVIALFTATALGPAVDAAQRGRLPRTWAIVAVYLACLLSMFAIGALIVPSVSSQIGRLSTDAQHAVGDLRANANVRRYDDRYHLTEKVQAQLRNLPAQTGRVAGPLRDVTVGAVGFASNLVAVLSIAFLLILHRDRYFETLVSARPSSRSPRCSSRRSPPRSGWSTQSCTSRLRTT